MGRDRNAHFFEGYFHGTPHADWADNIVRNGFNLDRAGNFGSDSGAGVYATQDKGWAAEHAFGVSGFHEDSEEYELEDVKRGRIIPVRLKPERPFHEPVGGFEKYPVHIQAAAQRIADKENERGLRGGKWQHQPRDFAADAIQEAGHDAWFQGRMAVAYDPSKVEVAGDPIDYKGHTGRDPEEDYWEAKRGWS